MKMKLQYLVLNTLILMLVSCSTKEIYEMNLNFLNSSSSNLTIQVFPKKPYIIETHYNFYNIMVDDTTRTGGPSTEFETDPFDISRAIIVTSYIDADPIEMVNLVFDSIYCTLGDSSQRVIKFYPDSVIDYPFNCFTDRDMWILDSTDYPAFCDMHCPNEHYYVTLHKFPIIDSLFYINTDI